MEIFERILEMKSLEELINKPGYLLMILISLLLLFLGIVKKYEPLLLVPFGFGVLIANIPESNLGVVKVDDSAGLAEQTYIDINNETMYITGITGNKLTVKRASYNTTAIEHVRGSDVKGITSADNALIEAGDDFGFSGT